MKTAIKALAMVALAGSSIAAQEFQWSDQMASGDYLAIEGINGEVRAELASGSEAFVEARYSGRRSEFGDVQVMTERRSDGITICVVHYNHDYDEDRPCSTREQRRTRGHNDTPRVEVDFVVRVPAGVRFDGHTVNGDVEVRDLRGDVQAGTVNGDVYVTTSGSAEASTVNGSIDVTMGADQLSGDADFHTVNGRITVRMARTINADFEGETVNGSVESDFPITIRGRFGPRTVSGVIGEGGPRLSMKTVNGSIRILEL